MISTSASPLRDCRQNAACNLSPATPLLRVIIPSQRGFLPCFRLTAPLSLTQNVVGQSTNKIG